MFSLSVREKFIRRVVSLSSRRLGGDTDAATEFDLQKRSLHRRWDDLLGTEKFLAGAAAVLLLLVIVQFVWIAVLQYNLYTLTEQARIQQTRIAQLEQSVKKHNNLLYSTEITMQDIEKKWHDLHFRVLQNTWKLDSKAETP
ncbi:hypothetical protein [Megasphaera stantonii]|uniref:hypothetical protein n=1 Tax=Megasphaera stantonii TaxID=2144175 RepID=UPI0013C2DCA4|nr:hypothetical protein [Megasphaera stantonii]